MLYYNLIERSCMYIDAHCHIGENMQELNKTSVKFALVNSATEDDWQKIIKLSKLNIGFVGAIGFHPWYIKDLKKGWQNRLKELLIENPELSVGEIGLDKYKPDIDRQEQVFIEQLNIACELQRTVSLHCVGAWDKVLQVFKSFQKRLPKYIICHSFNGSLDILNKLVKNYGAYISYSPMVIKSESDKVKNLIKETPKDKLLIESDSSDTSLCLQVADFIATIRPEEDIKNQIYKNGLLVIRNGQIA